MFEGLFSPWHIAIIAFVVFMVFGPKKLAARWEDFSHGVQHFIDSDGEPSADGAPADAAAVAPAPPAKTSLARRIGRWLHRRKRRTRLKG